MNVREAWTLRFVAIVFLGFIIGNLLFLDYIVLQERKVDSRQLSTVSNTTQTSDSCDGGDCERESVGSTTQTNNSDNENQVIEVPVISEAQNEYSISFGGGIVRSTEWQDVPGAASYIDGSRYQNIQSVVFEAGVYIPTGNQTAYVRLFNKTAKHPVWFSEVSLDGGEPKLLISQPITLDTGSNLYHVQVRSSLLYDVNLTDARVRVQTN